MSEPADRFTIVLTAPAGGDGLRALRWLLKRAGRLGLRATSVLPGGGVVEPSQRSEEEPMPPKSTQRRKIRANLGPQQKETSHDDV